ncbi:MAG: type IV pilin-like G/H family protein [Leptolyngbyaceae cyanobacterium MO_188.B28]|nr:type IV pilin-like G/H family protein [Leptolyngbyaceae cyanobacterium MO_188.B28]
MFQKKSICLGLFNRFQSESTYGFTVIELLVAILIISFLSAIALPSLLGQVHKAKETEAKTAVSTLRKDQYYFYLENNSFSQDLKDLNSLNYEIKKHSEHDYFETENYIYFVAPHESLHGRLHLAISKRKGLRSYGSAVYLKNNQLEECSLFPIDISSENSSSEIINIIQDASINHEQYCS